MCRHSAHGFCHHRTRRHPLREREAILSCPEPPDDSDKIAVPRVPSSAGPLRVGLLCRDFAQGGISRLMSAIVPHLSRMGAEVAWLVAASDYLADSHAASVIAEAFPQAAIHLGDWRGGMLPKADVVLSSNMASDTRLPLGPLAMLPTVVVVHGCEQLSHRCLRESARMSDVRRVVYNSEATRRAMLGFGWTADVPEEVIPVPFSWSMVPSGAVPDRRPSILYLGRLAPEKGLVEAAAVLREGLWQQPVDLDIVGDGWDSDRIRGEVESALAETLVRPVWHGWRDDPSPFLAEAGSLLIWSPAEGGPLILPEAIAAGCPVVSRPVGLAPQMAEQGCPGLAVAATPSLAIGALQARLSSLRPTVPASLAGVRWLCGHGYDPVSVAASYATVMRSARDQQPRA